MKTVWWVVKEIFGNKSSLIFAAMVLLPMIGTAVWKWNAWLDSRDEAAVTAVMYEQQIQTTEILSNQLKKRTELKEKDERAYANLALVNQALVSAKEQAVKELNEAVEYAKNANDGACNGYDFVPARELWVLQALVREFIKPENIYGGCAGVATGCAAARLRDAIKGRLTEESDSREDKVRGLRVGTNFGTSSTGKMRPEQRGDKALERSEEEKD